MWARAWHSPGQPPPPPTTSATKPRCLRSCLPSLSLGSPNPSHPPETVQKPAISGKQIAHDDEGEKSPGVNGSTKRERSPRSPLDEGVLPLSMSKRERSLAVHLAGQEVEAATPGVNCHERDG